MKGTRPLDNDEIRRVSAAFTGTFEVRNRGLFMIGVSIGGRISELLSLHVADVYQNNRPVTDLLFDKSILKGKVYCHRKFGPPSKPRLCYNSHLAERSIRNARIRR